MKVNFNAILKNLKGKPLKTLDENKKEIEMDLAFISSNALLAEIPTQPNQPVEDGRSKAIRGNLAKKIFNGGEVEVTAEDISKIKDRIGKAYGALIVTEAYDLLEGKKEETE